MKTALNIPFNQFVEILTTLHESMLLSFVTTIIMCLNEVSSLLEADVIHLTLPIVSLLQRKSEVMQSDSRPSVRARRNDRGSGDQLFLCL